MIHEGDLVWAYLTAPTKEIRGLGVVMKDTTNAPRVKGYKVPIRWNRRATHAVAADPIRYSNYQQRVQGAVVRAAPCAQRVIDAWLDKQGGIDDLDRS